MGAFYQTTAPGNYMDYTAQLPTELMAHAIQNTDTQIDNTQHQLEVSDDLLGKVQALTPDEAELKTHLAGYHDNINSLTQQLLANPMDYRKLQPNIRNLSRQLQNDEYLQRVQSNHSLFNNWDTTTRKLVDDGKITPEAYKSVRGNLLKSYATQGGAKGAGDGLYNTINTEELYHTPDLNAAAKKASDDIKAQMEEQGYQSANGAYIREVKGKKETVSPFRVAMMVQDALLADQNISGYLRQGAKYNYIPNLTDEKGNIKQPFQVDDTGSISKWDNSPLAQAIQSRVLSQSYTHQTQDQKLESNPVWTTTTNIQASADQQARSFKHADKVRQETWDREDKQAADKKKDELDLFKEKRDYLQSHPLTTGKTSTTKTTTTSKTTGSTSPGNLGAAAADYALKHTDNGKKPNLSDISQLNLPPVVGYMANIGTEKTDIYSDDKKTNQLLSDITKLEQAGQVNLANQKKSEYSNILERTNQARVNANNKLLAEGFSQGQIDQFNDYIGNEGKVKGLIKDIQFKVNNHALPMVGPGTTESHLSQEEQDLLKKHGNNVPIYKKMGKIVNDEIANYYKKVQTPSNELVGVPLTGKLEGIAHQAREFIDNNPDMINVYATDGDPTKPDVSLSDMIKDGYKITGAVSAKGAALKVRYEGKDYLLQAKEGGWNLNHLLADGTKDNKEPQVQQFRKEITNSQLGQLKYETFSMTPGTNKRIMIDVPDKENSGSTHKLAVRLKNFDDGTFGAEFWTGKKDENGRDIYAPFPGKDDKGNSVSLDKNFTRAALAEYITNAVYNP